MQYDVYVFDCTIIIITENVHLCYYSSFNNRLVDFSSLIRHTRPGSQKERPKTKTKEVIKNKKPPVEPLPEKNLLTLLTSDLPTEDTLDNTLLDMKPKVICFIFKYA